ncbi:MAG: penicillin-binding transpeptidase domain-containing protein, partial [Halocynthiibacter sp.]
LALTSNPTYDPNLFVRGISRNDYSALTENKYRPLAGKAVQGTYPPGSTVKMPAALAALESEAIPPEETVYCRGYIEVSGRRFHCWKRSGHGNMNMHDAITQSCDVYFYEIAQRVGIDKISEMAKRFGLGVKPDIPMSAVAHGLAPTKDWKRGRYGREWVIGDSLNAVIGQGYVLSSPLQLALMTARIASGRAVEPRLIKSVDGKEVPIPDAPSIGLNENDLRLIRQAMTSVSNSRRGTAYRSRVIEEDYR